MSRCWFVDDHRHLFEVQRLCELVELPRSTFYAWKTPTLSEAYLDDAWLANTIFDIHTASCVTYGAPRVRGQLRRHGHHVGRKSIARIMRELGLVGAHGRKKWRRGTPNTAPTLMTPAAQPNTTCRRTVQQSPPAPNRNPTLVTRCQLNLRFQRPLR